MHHHSVLSAPDINCEYTWNILIYKYTPLLVLVIFSNFIHIPVNMTVPSGRQSPLETLWWLPHKLFPLCVNLPSVHKTSDRSQTVIKVDILLMSPFNITGQVTMRWKSHFQLISLDGGKLPDNQFDKLWLKRHRRKQEWKNNGQQAHCSTLTFTRCFVQTVYCWVRVCGEQNMGVICVDTFPGELWFPQDMICRRGESV